MVAMRKQKLQRVDIAQSTPLFFDSTANRHLARFSSACRTLLSVQIQCDIYVLKYKTMYERCNKQTFTVDQGAFSSRTAAG